MVLPSLVSLADMCCIQFAYLEWVRVNVLNNGTIRDLKSLETVVSEAVRNLHLPEKLKLRVVKHIKPTAGQLVTLLKLWLSKLPSDTPQKMLICNMLSDCLVLSGDGRIHQRKTAQILLSKKALHNILAFRLACINFLETEVLKLWILVKEHFLNKIVREVEQPDMLRYKFSRTGFMQEVELEDINTGTKEPAEVLFWIGYCLSRENAVDLREVPHFMRSRYDWYEFALESAVDSGNVACFDYFKNFSGGTVEYNYLDRMNSILRSNGVFCQHSSFVFHFMLLNFEEKSELFRNCPRAMVNQFLQWPLSLTFLQNTEEVWNLVADTDKHWVFSEVYNVLIFENVVSYRGYVPPFFRSSPVYSEEHILGIWHALWNISTDNFKSAFLDFRIFPHFPDLQGHGFFITFEDSGMKQKLLGLFLSNSGALLELYQGESLQESLRSVITKYMPADLQDLERRYISLFETLIIPLRMFVGHRDKSRNSWQRGSRVTGRFLDYIKTVLFSMNKQTFSYN